MRYNEISFVYLIYLTEFTVVSYNSNGWHCRRGELINLLYTKTVDIMAIQETKLPKVYNTCQHPFRNYSVYSHPRKFGAGGLMMIVSR